MKKKVGNTGRSGRNELFEPSNTLISALPPYRQHVSNGQAQPPGPTVNSYAHAHILNQISPVSLVSLQTPRAHF